MNEETPVAISEEPTQAPIRRRPGRKPRVESTPTADLATSAAQVRETRKTDRKRIPMSIPRQKLQVPAIPGFHLHWFRDEPGRIPAAIQGGYDFVNAEEVDLNNFSLATHAETSGNSDLGSRVSIASGASGSGSPLRLYLMKIKQEWYDEDQAIIQSQCDRIDQTIKRGKVGMEKDKPEDISATYVRGNFQTNLNQRRP